MSKLCPRCRLLVLVLGRALAAVSSDGVRFGVVGICQRCVSNEAQLPKTQHAKRLLPALDRALDDPERYYCRLYPELNTAILAVGLLGHPELSERAMVALGWLHGELQGKRAVGDVCTDLF